jgi:hypothetical protein
VGFPLGVADASVIAAAERLEASVVATPAQCEHDSTVDLPSFAGDQDINV